MSSKGEEPNSGYGSGDESSALLAKNKPVLMRQDCTTSLSVQAAPHLSGLMGTSDESTGPPEEARSVPDIEMHCRSRPPHLAPHRCYCERRKSHGMARSVSRESVRSNQQMPPPVLLTPSSRIIRQSSQPEACHCCPHHGPAPTASLRQLREPGDGIAMIAADSLRINGAIRQFKQVSPPSLQGGN
nr:uncharacterized protein LOC112210441 [Halyomorpha halys]